LSIPLVGEVLPLVDCYNLATEINYNPATFHAEKGKTGENQ